MSVEWKKRWEEEGERGGDEEGAAGGHGESGLVPQSRRVGGRGAGARVAVREEYVGRGPFFAPSRRGKGVGGVVPQGFEGLRL